MTTGEFTVTDYDGAALLDGGELRDGAALLDGENLRDGAPSEFEAPRQNPNEAPTSIRRGAPADVAVPKNDDSWLPTNAL